MPSPFRPYRRTLPCPIDEPSPADTLPHDLPPQPNPFPSTYLSDPSRSTVDWSALASSFDLPFPAVPNPIDNPAPSSPFDWTHPATPIRSTTLLPPAHETCRSDSVLYDGPNPATPTDPIHPAHLDKPRRTNLTFPTCSDHVTIPLHPPRHTKRYFFVDTPCQLPPPTPLERVQYEYLQAEYVRNLGDAMDAATLHGP